MRCQLDLAALPQLARAQSQLQLLKVHITCQLVNLPQALEHILLWMF